ncbi:MAG: tyrosine-type recombinase/integrase [Anaerolineae bacterium]|jgi:integrase|nr:tyrosine-type recombinase/integrase [Anaerolineae bacterium]
MSHLPQRTSQALHTDALTFNFVTALPGRASSRHTARAYFRWVDQYLVDLTGLNPTKGPYREKRMSALPVEKLQLILSRPQLRAWLGQLVQAGHGKQGVEQARAAIVTLAELFAEAGWLPEMEAAAISRVRAPRAEDGQRPGRWLSVEQLKLLMAASREIATSDLQGTRNHLVVTILCTMALRREELSVARWGDLSLQNNRPVLRVHGKGRKIATIDLPRPVMRGLETWRSIVTASDHPPSDRSPLIRRVWKGGRISRGGLTPDGIWWIIDATATYAGIGHVAPHDLRRSVAGALHEAGTPVDKISQLLRHSSISVTERYLNRLARANEGAILMSNVLGLEDAAEQEEWPGFD